MPTERAPLTRTEDATLGASGALVTTSASVEAPFAGTVIGATYTATAAVTGAASPASRTLSVVNRGQDGTGTTVVATLALLGGVNLAAFDERALTLSAVAGATTVAAGDILEFRSAPVGGTGLADPGGTVTIEFSRD
jgi:hypothetical protein